MKLILPFFCLLLLSCGSNTSIVNSWRDPDSPLAKEQFKKILVVALVKDEATRRTVENRIASKNPVFKTSFEIFNENISNLSQDQKLKLLKSENFDGVLTMRLVSKDKETNYVPGTNTSMYYGGFGGIYAGRYGYGFGNWYGMYAPTFYSPGYYQENTYYMVETNIFSLVKNKLLWTGTTRSSNSTDVGVAVDEILNTIYKQMVKDGTIPKA